MIIMATQSSSIGQYKNTNTTTYDMNKRSTVISIGSDKSYSDRKNKIDKLNWKNQKKGK